MSYRIEILNAASKLFAERGFKDTSIADLSKLSGAAEGTIFHHFKNKEGILIELLIKVKKDILREVSGNIEKQGTGMDLVERAVHQFFTLSETMEFEFLLLFRNYPYQLAAVNPDCRKCIEEIYNCFLELFIEGIEKGQQDGTIRDCKPFRTAVILFAMVVGIVRFKLFNLYPVESFYAEIMDSCRKMLEPR
ncbi:TetR/AcrR family transcriptional regulator [Desulfonatronum thiodismutans]|uniref:TetR/AcrR family transcriptional regulator n=1 Tax=Desulfonatronum thiodismutans TaxID=159290 RepID=UPI0004ABDED7|nr:TetR/AcrR family transcriptional regulator [Desulfonatronum thiodismutans]